MKGEHSYALLATVVVARAYRGAAGVLRATKELHLGVCTVAHTHTGEHNSTSAHTFTRTRTRVSTRALQHFPNQITMY